MRTRKLSLLLSFLCLSAAQVLAAVPKEISDGRSAVTLGEIRAALVAAPPGVRESMTRDQMVRFIETLLIDKRLAAAADADRLAEQPEIKARMEKAARDVLVRAYVESVGSKLTAELPANLDNLARQRYEVEKANLQRPEAIRAAHILFRVAQGDDAGGVEAKAKAEKVLAELQAGADFAALAKEHSQDGAASQGGELGWRDKGALVAPFEKAAYALKPGEISGVVRTGFGYHIIKLLEYRPAAQLSFEDAKEQLLTKMKNELLSNRRAEWIRQFRGLTPVQIDDATLEALRKK